VTPVPLVVGDYLCLTVAQAMDEIQADGLEVGDVFPVSAGPTWIVVDQAPAAGATATPSTLVDLTAQEFACDL
jgi:beta-lactam-binding protein with PASTA domain